MGIYEEEGRWKVIAAGVIIVLLLLAAVAFFSHGSPVTVLWDREQVPPGGDALLYVIVRNTSSFMYRNVAVYVRPLSPYVSVFSEQNYDPHLFVIDSLPQGAEARARFLIKVASNAYSGDHMVEVSVAIPGETYVLQTGIRVG